jgi:predicted RNA-binding Zn-ribbon protein involved in translation (DUF1610 family)
MPKNERFVCDTCNLWWTNSPDGEMKCPVCGHILRAIVFLKEVGSEYTNADEIMAKIKVRDLGHAFVCEPALEIPILSNGFYEYAVTNAQAKYWNSLSKNEKDKLVKKADAEHKDLRLYLHK